MKVLYSSIMLLGIFTKTFGMEKDSLVLEQKEALEQSEIKKHYKCDVCGKTFGTRGVLKVHKGTHLEPQYSCDMCEKKFTQKTNVKTHKDRVHLKKRPFKCDQCGHTFFVVTELKTHCALVHQNQAEKLFKCDRCNAAFNNLGRFNQHKERHIQAPIVEEDAILESGAVEDSRASVNPLFFLADVAQSARAGGSEPEFFQAIEEANQVS